METTENNFQPQPPPSKEDLNRYLEMAVVGMSERNNIRIIVGKSMAKHLLNTFGGVSDAVLSDIDNGLVSEFSIITRERMVKVVIVR